MQFQMITQKLRFIFKLNILFQKLNLIICASLSSMVHQQPDEFGASLARIIRRTQCGQAADGIVKNVVNVFSAIYATIFPEHNHHFCLQVQVQIPNTFIFLSCHPQVPNSFFWNITRILCLKSYIMEKNTDTSAFFLFEFMFVFSFCQLMYLLTFLL